ncbi:hypothetical protein N657DRAFT_642175, partial [Parathielavia appendiculata]
MSQSRADTLQAHFSSADGAPRPILTSLNGDHSWLISFPRPAAERARTGSKAYFHVVSEPWLTGRASVGNPWIMEIRTETPAAIPSGTAVEAVIGEIEKAAASANLITPNTAPTHEAATDEASSPIDAIFLNFHYPDHLDEATLRTFDGAIPVFATPEAAAIARRWGHFSRITETRDLDSAAPTDSWPSLHPGGSLPEWLSVFRVPGHRELNFATAVVYSHQDNGDKTRNKMQHELLLYSPHGIKADQPTLRALLANVVTDSSSSPDDDSDASMMSVLAILHGLKESFSFGRATVLGVAGGLALERVAGPRYWVKSHDARLGYTGVLPFLARTNDVRRTMQSGLEEEEDKLKLEGEGDVNGGGGGGEGRREPNFVEVENGSCFVL